MYYVVAAAGLIFHMTFALPLYQWHNRLLAWIPLVIFLFLLRNRAPTVTRVSHSRPGRSANLYLL